MMMMVVVVVVVVVVGMRSHFPTTSVLNTPLRFHTVFLTFLHYCCTPLLRYQYLRNLFNTS